MMTVPEWIVVGVVTVFCVVVWWGIRELIETNRQTGICIGKINDTLGKIDGRIGKSEVWMEMHERQDDERYKEVKKSHEAMWEAINGMRV